MRRGTFMRVRPKLAVLALALAWFAPGPVSAQTEGPAQVLGFENLLEVSRSVNEEWSAGRTNQVVQVGHRLRTGINSRALMRSLLSQISWRVGARTTLEIRPPKQTQGNSTLNLKQGVMYFFGRDRPQKIDVETPTVAGAVRGTEFMIEVDENQRTVVTMIEGEVLLSNPQGDLLLSSGQQGTVDPNQAPRLTAVLMVRDLVQWALYYPAVIAVNELPLGAAEQQALTASLTAYQAGDLLAALAAYPANRQPATPAETVYLAQLLLAVGQVDAANALLNNLPADLPFPDILRRQIAVVKGEPVPEAFINAGNTNLASAWMVESYALQAKLNLTKSLNAAKQAARLAPEFGFAPVRVAELEFSFGRLREMQAALEAALRQSPRNAQAVALQGFVLAARNRTSEALRRFEEAIALDAGLANGWLGRGLVKIRMGQVEDGLVDLQVAATVEPQRAFLRSYLGKAFSQARNPGRALNEIGLAQQFDPGDPTAWLYAAMIKQQDNRVNEAVDDLERSIKLNDNRAVYRSRQLLDQDRAVRGANLAGIYEDAGMDNLSLREASRAVDADYANYSAHNFLANAYYGMRDPRQVNIRYETPWLTEYLVGNLLAPANAGTLSANVSQQEYGRLFERKKLGLVSATEYNSQGNWAQMASQYGLFGNWAYALDASWRAENGTRPNSDFEQTTLAASVKQELGASDSLFLQGAYYDAESGDVAQYYDNQTRFPNLRVHERQEPLLMAGYHHQWSPQSHTLLLGGFSQDELERTNPDHGLMSQRRPAPGAPPDALPASDFPVSDFSYQSRWEVYSWEGQQILAQPRNTIIGGVRFQGGNADLSETLGGAAPVGYTNNRRLSNNLPPIYYGLSAYESQREVSFQRATVYAYDIWQIADSLRATAGFSYDHLESPVNFAIAPATGGQNATDLWSPKAGLQWTPLTNLNLRAAYTRSLGGVVYDQSFRLEPVHVAGFNQAYRGLIPMAVEGAASAEEFETIGLALDYRFPTRTYLGLQVEELNSDADRSVGSLDWVGFPPTTQPSQTPQHLEYRERSFSAHLNQLIADQWALGASYRLTDSRLYSQFPELTPFNFFAATKDQEAILHQVDLYALFTHRCGLFSRFDAVWLQQSNRGYAPDIPGDDLWQFNFYAGYRFWQRRAELKLGVLNLTDQDYQLNPLNPILEYPREREFMVSLKLAF